MDISIEELPNGVSVLRIYGPADPSHPVILRAKELVAKTQFPELLDSIDFGLELCQARFNRAASLGPP